MASGQKGPPTDLKLQGLVPSVQESAGPRAHRAPAEQIEGSKTVATHPPVGPDHGVGDRGDPQRTGQYRGVQIAGVSDRLLAGPLEARRYGLSSEPEPHRGEEGAAIKAKSAEHGILAQSSPRGGSRSPCDHELVWLPRATEEGRQAGAVFGGQGAEQPGGTRIVSPSLRDSIRSLPGIEDVQRGESLRADRQVVLDALDEEQRAVVPGPVGALERLECPARGSRHRWRHHDG